MNKLDRYEFIWKAIQKHGYKYDYRKVKYINAKTKVCIICHEKDEDGNEHGEFWQSPDGHLKGHNCLKCTNSGVRLTTEDFIRRAKKVLS